ncbi:hypothetical protein M427DRAFT_45588 [Gonapodya prolifera JEL478]|uniref:Uncharacterized protein n=1 Tax=Gonapodya prolifera (strain JEL478) TaxID=1344416 RepID=A0A139AAI1_GONPJ|nr:hypothetical protein M427DRAFT_45588 [Gonapodya prolifera JEL478]|eukprot:KXS13664.1 hypothetical protein M427DRAFT_45588 [Gonapodya prolifera JEL478]
MQTEPTLSICKLSLVLCSLGEEEVLVKPGEGPGPHTLLQGWFARHSRTFFILTSLSTEDMGLGCMSLLLGREALDGLQKCRHLLSLTKVVGVQADAFNFLHLHPIPQVVHKLCGNMLLGSDFVLGCIGKLGTLSNNLHEAHHLAVAEHLFWQYHAFLQKLTVHDAVGCDHIVQDGLSHTMSSQGPLALHRLLDPKWGSFQGFLQQPPTRVGGMAACELLVVGVEVPTDEDIKSVSSQGRSGLDKVLDKLVEFLAQGECWVAWGPRCRMQWSGVPDEAPKAPLGMFSSWVEVGLLMEDMEEIVTLRA